MLFTIVSERQGVTNQDTRRTPGEALLLASDLVKDGIDKVWVFDDRGQFVSASALSQAAGRQAAASEVQASTAPDGTVDLLACDAGPSRTDPEGEARAATSPDSGAKSPTPRAARVFRMATHRT